MTDQVEGGEAVTETAPAKVDGRGLRAERTRTRILEAARGLIALGILRPKVEDIAREAKCSTRSVFQHFTDVAALYAAALTPELRTGHRPAVAGDEQRRPGRGGAGPAVVLVWGAARCVSGMHTPACRRAPRRA